MKRLICYALVISIFSSLIVLGSSHCLAVDENALLTPSDAGTVSTLDNGKQVFSDRPVTRVFTNLPDKLIGKYYILDSINGSSSTVNGDCDVFVLTPEVDGTAVLASSLAAAGFSRDTTISAFKAFAEEADNEYTVVYHKVCKAGESLSFGKWGILVFGTLNADNAFSLESLARVTPSEGMGKTVAAGGAIFSNRSHVFGGALPTWLTGTDYLYSSLGTLSATVTQAGWVYVLTPTNGGNTQQAALAAEGFTPQASLDPAVLSSTISEPIVLMGKHMEVGDTYSYDSWGVSLTDLSADYVSANLTDAGLKAPAVQIYPTTAEYQDGNRLWQGIPGIERAENGRLWASWYSGSTGENEYNWAVLYTSDNDGASWSGPAVVIDPDIHVRAFDPSLWMDPNGRLWFFWNQQLYGDGRIGVWAIHTDDPQDANPTWSNPQRLANGIMINKPVILRDGTWLIPTAIWGGTGGVPDDISVEENSNVYASTDQGATWAYRGSVKGYQGSRNCDENMIYEKQNGTLVMYIRTGLGIEKSTSSDKGYTWTNSQDAGLSATVSRFHVRRLASGRLMLIYNNPPSGADRSFMTVALSDDDGATWPYKLVLDARSGVSYPDATQDGNGNIYIVYDRNRTTDMEILMAKVTEADIVAGKLITQGSFLTKMVDNNKKQTQSLNITLGTQAEVQSASGAEGTVVQNTELFTTSGYTLGSGAPAGLLGASFLRVSMDSVSMKVKKSGWVYVLTPDGGQGSQKPSLLHSGFHEIASLYPQTLSPAITVPICLLGKQAVAGETVSYGGWGIPLVRLYAEEGSSNSEKTASSRFPQASRSSTAAASASGVASSAENGGVPDTGSDAPLTTITSLLFFAAASGSVLAMKRSGSRKSRNR